jgi:hypothetical protein
MPGETFYVVDERTGALFSVPPASVLVRENPAPIAFDAWRRHVVDAAHDENSFVQAEMLTALCTFLNFSTAVCPHVVLRGVRGSVVYAVRVVLTDVETATQSPKCAGASMLWLCSYNQHAAVFSLINAYIADAEQWGTSFVDFIRRFVELGMPVTPELPSLDIRPSPTQIVGAERVLDYTNTTSDLRLFWLCSPTRDRLFREEDEEDENVRMNFAEHRRRRDHLLEVQQAARIAKNSGMHRTLNVATKRGRDALAALKTARPKHPTPAPSTAPRTAPFPLSQLGGDVVAHIVGIATSAVFETHDVEEAGRAAGALRLVSKSFRSAAALFARARIRSVALELARFVALGDASGEVESALARGGLPTLTYELFSCSPLQIIDTLDSAEFTRGDALHSYMVLRKRTELAFHHDGGGWNSCAQSRVDVHRAIVAERARRPTPPKMPQPMLSLQRIAVGA